MCYLDHDLVQKSENSNKTAFLWFWIQSLSELFYSEFARNRLLLFHLRRSWKTTNDNWKSRVHFEIQHYP